MTSPTTKLAMSTYLIILILDTTAVCCQAPQDFGENVGKTQDNSGLSGGNLGSGAPNGVNCKPS